MSDTEQLPDDQDADLDDYAHQACYVFKSSSTSLNERPNKRRKTTHEPPQTIDTLPLLCNGVESTEYAHVRHETFHKLWDQQQTRIDETVTQLDNDALKNIMHFAEKAGQDTTEGNLQAGLIVSGSDTSVQVRLLGQWRTSRSTSTELVCELRSSSCQNLQTALKNIIKTTISEAVGQDGYLDFFAKHKRMIPMNFDLELLELFVKQYNTSRVVISMLDVETFDTNILSELISALSSWSGRIPFVALIGIATTVELFELRLPKSIIRLLEVKVFTLSSPSNVLYNILSDMQTSKDSSLLFGPATVSMLHDMSQNQSTTIESFTKMLKCVYMSHFFANCLSILLGNLEIEAANASLLCEAIRNTKSFQNHCEQLLSQGKPSLSIVRDLLDNDAELLDAASSAIRSGQDDYRSAIETVIAISDLRQQVKPSGKETGFQIDLKLYSSLDDLTGSDVFEELILELEELKSSEILDILAATQDTTKTILGVKQFIVQIQHLHETEGLQSITPPRVISTFTPSITTTNSPSKRKAQASPKLTSAKNEFKSIVDALIETMTTNVQAYSFDLSKTFLHEAFIYNSRQPLQNAFTPRPRFALERALHKPSDYLSCECCTSHSSNNANEDDNTDRQKLHPPPTSVLYNLLQEAGTIINVRDLFDAFSSRLFPNSSSPLGPMASEDENEDEDENANNVPEPQAQRQKQRLTLALFYRSLSELKALGMVKGSTSAITKKRALVSNGGNGEKGKRGYADIDFVAKTSWAGL